MVFIANQEQNESYKFKETLLQPDNPDLILAIIKEAEAHEARSHCIFTKTSEVNNNLKNKYGKLKTVLSIW